MKPEEDIVMRICMLEKDEPEYDRIRQELIKVLDKVGGYEPATDDLLIDQIARSAIYFRNSEVFLDSETATDYTYARVADTKLKFAKIIESAMHQLAISRRDRMGSQTQAGLMNELREAMMRGLKNAGK
jgi:hypothetical protein